MAVGLFVLYDSFSEFMGDGLIDLDDHVFKIALVTSTYTWSAAHDLYNDITNELTTANGYTIGGGTLPTVTWVRTANITKFTSGNFVWTASGAGITARRAIVYDDTAAGKPLLGSYLLDDAPANLVTTSGNQLTVGPHPTNGWFTHQVN